VKITKALSAGTIAMTMIASAALAQENLSGTISKIDEASGKIAIQRTQEGTVGINTNGGAAQEYKVSDGLVFNSFQADDKVVFTATDIDGAKLITKIQKQQ
jgi:Cu/Ag efflux protein CusF